MSTHLTMATQDRPHYGIWLLTVAAIIGVVLSAIAYFTLHGPIAGSWGALIVCASTALMVIAALLIGLAAMPRGLVTLFQVLIILDILATGFCAYFLEAYALLAFMAIALIGWLLQVRSHPNPSRQADS